MRTLAIATLILSAADHWTTYVCLRQPVEGWLVMEANPISEWLFRHLGLIPGLLLDSVLTLMGVAFLLTSRVFPVPARSAFFGVVIVWTAYAVHNNMRAMSALGLAPFGGGLS